MGMLIEGEWSTEDQIIENGAYCRELSTYRSEITVETILNITKHPGRYHLICSWSCPWSHRTMISRTLHRLEEYIPLHITGGQRVEGYPANYGDLWLVPGTDKVIMHLHQLYKLHDSSHTGRPTVPVLWDSQECKIISNESAQIMRALDKVIVADDKFNFTLVPGDSVPEINALNQKIYTDLSNGVYESGFATSQQAYEQALERVFSTLNGLETSLSKQRYLLGSTITEADWRLFPTLIRFYIDYYIHSRCTLRRLVDYPTLWAYTRDLYQWKGIAKTVNLDAINLSNYLSDTVVPRTPELNLGAPHNRDSLGPPLLVLQSGDIASVDPKTLEPIGVIP